MTQCRVDMAQENIISTFAGAPFYGSEDAYIREFLQNAIDACNTRSAFEWSWGTEFLELEEAQALNSMRAPYQPKIAICYEEDGKRLSFTDNGIGINAHDIEQYVAKTGVSFYTSADFLAQQLHYEPIAQFGVGLLSGFMAARALLIESRKDKSVNTAWNVTDRQSLEPITAKWLEGAETIEYISAAHERSGTRMTLVLKPEYAKRMSLSYLTDAVRHYMLYQPFPIEVTCGGQTVVAKEPNRIMDNPFADVLGIVSIRIMDDLMEGCIWIYNSKHAGMMEGSRLYQQGFLVADDRQELGLKPEWLRHMTYRLHLRKKFLSLRPSRDGVTCDAKLQELRRLIGRRIVEYFAKNPLGLNQYLADGKKPVLAAYEEEMKLLTRAVMVEVYVKGRQLEMPIATVLRGYQGKKVRIAYIAKGLFTYFRANHAHEFRKFLSDNRLVVFEKNRDIFSQILAPYRRDWHYVISECPGVIYEVMEADFSARGKAASPYASGCQLRPEGVGGDDVFCMVPNGTGTLELIINPRHRLSKLLAPVWYEPKVHRMMAVVCENIKQRIINTQHRWDRIVDFGGSFVDDWDPEKIATVQSVWCLESDFDVSVNEYIGTCLTKKERMDYGLVGLIFHKEDFINWWFTPRE